MSTQLGRTRRRQDSKARYGVVTATQVYLGIRVRVYVSGCVLVDRTQDLESITVSSMVLDAKIVIKSGLWRVQDYRIREWDETVSTESGLKTVFVLASGNK